MISRLLAFAALSLTGSGTCVVCVCRVRGHGLPSRLLLDGLPKGLLLDRLPLPRILLSHTCFLALSRGLSGSPPFLCLRDGKVSMPAAQLVLRFGR
jgi:hypothetical protein